MVHEEDPKDVIFKQVGMTKDLKIPGFTLFGNRVLCGIYEMPEKTRSGIIMPDRSRDESKHQGKAWLVLALGPTAFVSDDQFTFGPEHKLEVGDWCMGFVSLGMQCTINGQLCRLVRDQDIPFKIPFPDQVW
jgi:co-chaperonin GroES (HSP10)